MQNLLQDLRYGVRLLFRNPSFTTVAVLSLALGISANTTIFSVFDAIFLRTLPVQELTGWWQFLPPMPGIQGQFTNFMQLSYLPRRVRPSDRAADRRPVWRLDPDRLVPLNPARPSFSGSRTSAPTQPNRSPVPRLRQRAISPRTCFPSPTADVIANELAGTITCGVWRSDRSESEQVGSNGGVDQVAPGL